MREAECAADGRESSLSDWPLPSQSRLGGMSWVQDILDGLPVAERAGLSPTPLTPIRCWRPGETSAPFDLCYPTRLDTARRHPEMSRSVLLDLGVGHDHSLLVVTEPTMVETPRALQIRLALGPASGKAVLNPVVRPTPQTGQSRWLAASASESCNVPVRVGD